MVRRSCEFDIIPKYQAGLEAVVNVESGKKGLRA